jgi:DNA-binding winged helix-turn-helix (wHTH) protein/tetratricopeptide (TPR) repeat protein
VLIYRFGPFVLDPAERALRRDGGNMAVPGKAWQILVMLAEAAGRLVTHETMRAKLWPNIVVEDRTLTVHVSTLRKALGSGAYIETVAGVGYRLAVPVQVMAKAGSATTQASLLPVSRRLAVRPFSTTGLAPNDRYLGVGMADALTNMLSAIPGLTVAPVAVADRISSGSDTLEAVRPPGMDQMLEGSVDLNDERLQVSARLVDTSTGRTRLAETFARSHASASTLQEAITQWVAQSMLQSTDLDPVRSYHPRSSEAFFLQLQARASLRAHAPVPAMRALVLFEQAVAADPDYGLAHAGLASSYMLLGSTAIRRPLPIEEAMPMARQSAERALALDEKLDEAWAVLGRIKMEYDWDWEGAEADLAHAVALNPSSVDGLISYGQFLGTMGHLREAVEVLQQALRVDATAAEAMNLLGFIHSIAGDADRALDLLGRMARFPGYRWRALLSRILVLDEFGRRDEAMQQRLDWLRLEERRPDLADGLADTNRTRGWEAAMDEWIEMMERASRWTAAAFQSAVAGRSDHALECLEHARSQRFANFPLLLQGPSLRSLRGHPRFRAILRGLRLEGRSFLEPQ